MRSFDTFIESKFYPISITEPGDSFEKGILTSYDTCREEALKKYFPMLDNENIKLLLQDNYLQKSDFNWRSNNFMETICGNFLVKVRILEGLNGG